MDETSTENFYENPILNSPYECPTRHWELKDGRPTQKINDFRRPVDFVTPIARPRAQNGARPQQQELLLDEAAKKIRELGEGDYHRAIINEIRNHVDEWRKLPEKDWGVTAVTARLLSYWRNFDGLRGNGFRPFFCQVEAVETAIWLTEVAPKKYHDYLEKSNKEANPGLNRLALKLATGAGKTAVMAMIIAWQTLNAVRNPSRKNFTKGFLIVTPGITIRDRLRVLLPNDPESYYSTRRLVPEEMLSDMQNANIVITNYQAFRRAEKLDISSETRKLLRGWRKEDEIKTTETDGEMLRRVIPSLMSLKNVMVINDEAHHCYREKQGSEDDRIARDEVEEAEENNEAARLWISGLEVVQQKLGISRIFDLSATPFFLRGSGYAEGTLFPWTMSDFSLMDAIECGIVKLPRVPIDDNDPRGELIYRNLWENIRDRMPRMGRRRIGNLADLNPEDLPLELQTAIEILYGNYKDVFKAWEKEKLEVEPCFVIVCTNTSHSKLIYDYISGYHRKSADGKDLFYAGKCELFSNFDEHGKAFPRPRTLLIDSRELESGDALTDEFRETAKDEIENFKREMLLRGGKFSAKIQRGKELDASEILREVMNTVGKPGKLGGSIRCVVSVSMLTEGWDANTVTHILGIRAFGTQLLCEQVVGRALRRYSYDLNEKARFDVEYSNIFGIPFEFVAPATVSKPKAPAERVHVYAEPDRSGLEITFPRVVGYRREFQQEKISAKFNEESRYVLTPEKVGATEVTVAGVIGEAEELYLSDPDSRENTVLMKLTRHLLLKDEFRDAYGAPKVYLFGQLHAIVKKWFKEYFSCVDGTHPAQLCYNVLANEVCEKIVTAITRAAEENAQNLGVEPPIRVLLDPYTRVGSTRYVDFVTLRKLLWATDVRKAHLNFHVCDSEWERSFCRIAEKHPSVKAYVKNQGLGFEVPYVLGGESHYYVPDFILLMDDGHGDDDLLHLVVEIKGFRGEDARVKKETMETCWIPGVNRLGEFGRWKFLEITEPYEMGKKIDARLVESQLSGAI